MLKYVTVAAHITILLYFPVVSYAQYSLDNCVWRTVDNSPGDASIINSPSGYIIAGGCYSDYDPPAATMPLKNANTVHGGVWGEKAPKAYTKFRCDHTSNTNDPPLRFTLLSCAASAADVNTLRTNSGVVQSQLSVVRGQWLYFQIDADSSDYALVVDTWGSRYGEDADLYIQQGVPPSRNDYLCRSISSDNSESCELEDIDAGTYFIGVYAYRNFSAVDLRATLLLRQAGDPIGIYSDQVQSNLTSNQGDWIFFKILATDEDYSLHVDTWPGHYGEDADLYIRYGAMPDFYNYQCRSISSDNTEHCHMHYIQPGVYYIGVYAYRGFTDLELNASVY